MLLIAVRHLSTRDNEDQRFGSGDRDIPILTGQSIPQLTLNALIEVLPVEYELADTGLIRTIETRALLQRALDYAGHIITIPEFKERIGGQLAGKPFSELQQLYPALRLPSDFWRVEDPARGLESSLGFLGRLECGLEIIRQRQRSVVLVAHAGTLKGISAILDASSQQERSQILASPTPPNGHVSVFQL